MTSSLSDTALERAYVAELLCTYDAPGRQRHLASPDRLNSLDCAQMQTGRVLSVVHELAALGHEISPITVRQHFEQAGQVNHVAAVEDIFAGYEPRADSLGAMAARLNKLAEARSLRGHLALAMESIGNLHLDAAQEHARDALAEAPRSRVRVLSAHDVALIAANAAIRGAQSSAAVIRSGLPMLDDAYGGLPRGTMLTIGGTTGSGKSSLMLNMAKWLACHGHRPGIVSCEDSDAIWGGRVLSHLAAVNPQQLQSAQLDFDASAELERGIDYARSLGIAFTFTENRPLHDVLTAMRDLLSNHHCDVIMVDYIQAIRLGHGAKRAELVSDAAQALKGECQQHGVPLVLASQLNRADKNKPYAEPHARDLKETGDLENMSDVVVLLWKTSDEEGALALGKVAKVKWSPKRPRFEVTRNPVTGALINLIPYYPPRQPANGHAARDWT